ncbi:hypothetical protein M427DRAFT_70684 [Gonapodya prolifera JEL478]|uniref:Osmotin, thaumatin-like protein n=1 Tax=Gonapodya prolifera (strain JEL478) TaxID=1344416 RepID=A0A139ACD4_GONPJ|nr:hypothetical protein M427DRAFT_70684 [Gonapodya prolifera JEL478]|eukprot:KXS14472.1 hypothetical protein M427DRAFT_70684 [Gonapodya prolifera JEL478]
MVLFSLPLIAVAVSAGLALMAPQGTGAQMTSTPPINLTGVDVVSINGEIVTVNINDRGTKSPRVINITDVMIHVTDQNDFCLILPPGPNQLIADTEYGALAYCTSGPQRLIPPGFVYSAHFHRALNAQGQEAFIQLTGLYNETAFPLVPGDAGGQTDSNGIGCGSKGCPPLATCKGYDTFIQLLGNGIYCLRCCHDHTYCPDTFDTRGCLQQQGGNYGPGFDNVTVQAPTSGGFNLSVTVFPDLPLKPQTTTAQTTTTVAAASSSAAAVSTTANAPSASVTTAAAAGATGAAKPGAAVAREVGTGVVAALLGLAAVALGL